MKSLLREKGVEVKAMYIGNEGDSVCNAHEPILRSLCDVTYHPYPPPDTVARYQSIVDTSVQKHFDPNVTLFVGQIPYALPHTYIPWAVDLIVEEYSCTWVKPVERAGGAKIWVLRKEQAEELKSSSERLLFDVCGAWIARSKAAAAVLAECAKSKIESRLARSCMTIVAASTGPNGHSAEHHRTRSDLGIPRPPVVPPVVGVPAASSTSVLSRLVPFAGNWLPMNFTFASRNPQQQMPIPQLQVQPQHQVSQPANATSGLFGISWGLPGHITLPDRSMTRFPS